MNIRTYQCSIQLTMHLKNSPTEGAAISKITLWLLLVIMVKKHVVTSFRIVRIFRKASQGKMAILDYEA